MWRFLKNLKTAETLSRLHLSSKSLPGVLEDVEIHDEPGGGVIWQGSYFRSFCESFIKIQHQKICQDSTFPPSLSLESLRMWRFHKNLKTAETLSRLHLSSKSLPGVLEDVEIPYEPGGGVR